MRDVRETVRRRPHNCGYVKGSKFTYGKGHGKAVKAFIREGIRRKWESVRVGNKHFRTGNVRRNVVCKWMRARKGDVKG